MPASMSAFSPRSNSPGRQPGMETPAGLAPRMLRVEFKGQPYDWFNLDEMGDVLRTEDFANTLRENIVHYFNVPFDFQAISDEEGPLCSATDFARTLKSARPCLQVWDIREIPQDVKEQLTHKLAYITFEVNRYQRNLGIMGGGPPASPRQQPPPMGSWAEGQQQRPVSPWPVRAEPSAASLADRLVSNGTMPQQQQPFYGAGPPVLPGGAPGTWPSNCGSRGMATANGAPPLRQYDMGMRQPGWQQERSVISGLEVVLSKDPMDRDNSRFGFANVPATNGRALLITWVDPSGLLGKWNREHPDRVVHEGDIILSVNSATEDVEAMRQQLHGDVIRMRVQPGNAGGPLAP